MENTVPIYLQLADEIKISIMSGRYEPGERLPSVRDLAVQKKVNPNTLQRALLSLEREGLVYTERTNGKFVTENRKLIESARRVYAKKITADYRAKMREIGLKPKF